MATPKLVKMGIKRKDMYGSGPTAPKSEKEYDKEEVRPEIHLSGEHAKMMGAEDLKKGDRVRQTVEWVVGSHSKHEENGKEPRYEMTLCLDKAGDHSEVGEDKTGKGDEDDGDGADDSPAMAYITGRGKPAE